MVACAQNGHKTKRGCILNNHVTIYLHSGDGRALVIPYTCSCGIDSGSRCMEPMRLTKLVLVISAICCCLVSTGLSAQTKAIDVNKSSLKIRVFKSGAFSAFAHDHEIQAPLEEGKIDEGKREPGKAAPSSHASV